MSHPEIRDSLWVTDLSAKTLLRIDPATGAVIARITITETPPGGLPGAADIWLAGGFVWVGNLADGAMARINPATNEVDLTIELPGAPLMQGNLVNDDAVWISDAARELVYRFDPTSGAPAATIDVPAPGRIIAAGGAIWVASWDLGTLSRIDPATNQVVGMLPTGVGAVAVDGEALWATVPNDNMIIQIAPSP